MTRNSSKWILDRIAKFFEAFVVEFKKKSYTADCPIKSKWKALSFLHGLEEFSLEL